MKDLKQILLVGTDRLQSSIALMLLLGALLIGGMLWQTSVSGDVSDADYGSSHIQAVADTVSALPAGEGVDAPAVALVKTGEASFYSHDFAGNLTANGERFDPEALTAAHPSLPMDTMLRVTNLSNNRVVEVRVNDRGPFSGNRVLDLSRRAAEKIGMIQAGHAHVRIEVLK